MADRLHIISLDLHHISFDESLSYVIALAKKRQPSFICFANAHMVIEAHIDTFFSEQVNNADLVLADGKPIALSCQILHHKKQERIAGMDMMPEILRKANDEKLSIFIYGSTADVIHEMKNKIHTDFPNIQFAGSISPPFRVLTDEEIKTDIDCINRSGAQLVFVSLGCPKQEKWMAANYKKINAVLLGIGGALPVVAGLQKRAPQWMQQLSLEWFYRLLQQPRRLFGRYLYTNPYFIFLLGKELVRDKFKK